jgi:hypothetical protein
LPEIVFFTCANKAYEHFALLYAASVLSHIDSAVVEIGLEDADAFARHNPGVSLLQQHYPGRLSLRTVEWAVPGRDILPGSVRFINEPLTAARWTYIGDIDVIFLDRYFFRQHLAFMARTGLPYSNCLRPGTNRLSGLHLVRSDAWFPLPSLDGLDLVHDEVLLRDICLRKGLPIQTAEWFRPVHGIHVSPNRCMSGWSVLPWRTRYLAFAQTEVFKALRPLLTLEMRRLLEIIDDEVASPAVLRSVRANVAREPIGSMTYDAFTRSRQKLMNEKDYEAAAELGLRFLASNPDHATALHHTAYALGALHLYPEALELQRRAVALDPERQDYPAGLERLEWAVAAGPVRQRDDP